ncbi:Benzoylformate decarboxylase [bacterium HR40]|nr:Benzoylformate decarboxylase [bacterium HR40]
MAAPLTVAEAWLALLKARGVDFLFGNAGTDFAPVIEALVRGREAGIPMPEPVTVTHEHAAVSIAHGYWLATGRPQAVMVHVNVGTANAVMGLFNAARDRVPILFTAGRTPLTEEGPLGARDLPIHWGQDMPDQGGLVRGACKWTAELLHPAQLPLLVERALAIATSPPMGPVYVGLPREILAMPVDGRVLGPAGLHAASRPAPDPAAIDEAARLVARAERPLLIAARESGGGRGFDHLLRFAERFAVPVVEFWPSRLSFPTTHPLHGGFDPAPWLAEADLVLVLDALVPWIPKIAKPRPGVPVIAIGCDPLFTDTPFRGHRSDLSILADTALALDALSAALADRVTGRDDRLEERRRAIAARARELREQRLAAARAQAGPPMSPAFVSTVLSEVLAAQPEEAVVVSELGCLPQVMRLERPGSYFGHSLAGGLGWGLPCAIGLRMARPDALVVATVGDGSYIFANPLACHQFAAAQQAPVLTVVFDNGEWHAVRRTTAMVYPEGCAVRANVMPFTALAPAPDYRRVVEACGGRAERVEQPADLRPALERALATLREDGCQVLLDVVVRSG